MSGDQALASSTADYLHSAFDRSFAEARRGDIEPLENLLAIQVGGAPYVIRLTAIAGLFADRKVTHVPSPVAELMGVASFRGAMVPVFDLRALLGHPGTGTPRWLVLAVAETPLALTFDKFDGYLHLPRSVIVTADCAEVGRRHVHELAHTTDGTRPIIHIPSIFDAITTRTRHGFSQPRSDKR